jgi:hypothetical protein
MNDTTVGVLVTMEEDVTTKMPGVTNSIIDARSATRELSQGTAYLSSMMMSMGVAMSATSNSTAKAFGNMLMMLGGIGNSITMAARFVSAMGRMTHALQQFNMAQLIANLLSGPAGWAKVLIGGALIGGAAYGISKVMSGGSGATTSTTVVNNHIAGSVVTEQQVIDITHQGLLKKGTQNNTTGIK